MKSRHYFALGLFLSWICCCVPPSVATEVDGTLSLVPIGEHSCIAVRIDHSEGGSIGGLAWYNNDATTTFPHVLIVEGGANTPPDIANAGLVLADVSGASLGWSTLPFPTPITSTAEAVYAVFELPEGAEHTGEGLGGGPAIGYNHTSGGSTSFMSPDATQWVRVADHVAIAVVPTVVMGKGITSSAALSELRKNRPTGWWDDPVTPDEAGTTDYLQQRGRETIETVMLNASPNPFNPGTTLDYHLPAPSMVSLRIFDARGRVVRDLHRGMREAGQHSSLWNGRDSRGASVSSGVYHVLLETDFETKSERLVLVR